MNNIELSKELCVIQDLQSISMNELEWVTLLFFDIHSNNLKASQGITH